MGGSRIKKAIEALTIFIKSLPEDSYFNIYSFGSSHEKMFSESARYENSSVKLAEKSINLMSADLGGT